MSACGFHEDKNTCAHQLTHIRTEGFGMVIIHEWERKVIEFEMKRKKKFERRRSNNSCGNFYCFQPHAWAIGSSLQSETEKRTKIVNMKPDEIINDLESYDTHIYKKIDKVNCEEQGENMINKEWKFELENMNKQRSIIEYNLDEQRPSEGQQGELNNMNRKTEEVLFMNKEQKGEEKEREIFNEHRPNKMQEQRNVYKRKDSKHDTMNKRPKIVCNMNKTRPENIEEQEEMKLNEELALFKKFYLKKN